MQRRTFLAATAATLALPAAVRAQARPRCGSFRRSTSPSSIRTSTVYVTRNYGYMVFDTLFGQDAISIHAADARRHVTENDGGCGS